MRHLTRWTTPEQLRVGAVAGHVLETFVVSEALKSRINAGTNLRGVWFYCDFKKREMDLEILTARKRLLVRQLLVLRPPRDHGVDNGQEGFAQVA